MARSLFLYGHLRLHKCNAMCAIKLQRVSIQSLRNIYYRQNYGVYYLNLFYSIYSIKEELRDSLGSI